MFIKNQIRSSVFFTEMKHSCSCQFLMQRGFNDIFHYNTVTACANIVKHDDNNVKLQKCNCTEISKTALQGTFSGSSWNKFPNHYV